MKNLKRNTNHTDNSIFSVDRETPVALLLTDMPTRVSKRLGDARKTGDSMVVTKKVVGDDEAAVSDY